MIDTNALQKYSLFGGVLPDQIERIKPLFGYARYDAGDMPMREGDPNDKIFFIIGGRVMVSKQGISIAELGEGETFGDLGQKAPFGWNPCTARPSPSFPKTTRRGFPWSARRRQSFSFHPRTMPFCLPP